MAANVDRLLNVDDLLDDMDFEISGMNEVPGVFKRDYKNTIEKKYDDFFDKMVSRKHVDFSECRECIDSVLSNLVYYGLINCDTFRRIHDVLRYPEKSSPGCYIRSNDGPRITISYSLGKEETFGYGDLKAWIFTELANDERFYCALEGDVSFKSIDELMGKYELQKPIIDFCEYKDIVIGRMDIYYLKENESSGTDLCKRDKRILLEGMSPDDYPETVLVSSIISAKKLYLSEEAGFLFVSEEGGSGICIDILTGRRKDDIRYLVGIVGQMLIAKEPERDERFSLYRAFPGGEKVIIGTFAPDRKMSDKDWHLSLSWAVLRSPLIKKRGPWPGMKLETTYLLRLASLSLWETIVRDCYELPTPGQNAFCGMVEDFYRCFIDLDGRLTLEQIRKKMSVLDKQVYENKIGIHGECYADFVMLLHELESCFSMNENISSTLVLLYD